MRIQKYCSNNGICSRREAEALILKGMVKVNGQKVKTLGTQIDPDKDVVTIEGVKERATYIAYKPAQLSMDDFLPLPAEHKDLPAICPLDKKNEGLVVYSNDPAVQTALMRDTSIARTFVVTMRDELPQTKIKFLEKILKDIDSDTKISSAGEKSLRLITGKPKKTDMRVLAELAKTTVESIKCVAIGGIKLINLRPGGAKILSSSEIDKLIN